MADITRCTQAVKLYATVEHQITLKEYIMSAENETEQTIEMRIVEAARDYKMGLENAGFAAESGGEAI